MYEFIVNGNDIGFPTLNKTSTEKFDDISSILFDIYSFPLAYPGFPQIPDLFDNEGKINNIFSIVKKGETFFIVKRGCKGGKYLETMMPFSMNQIKFSFTIYDFPDINQLDFVREPQALSTEPLLNIYVFDILGVN